MTQDSPTHAGRPAAPGPSPTLTQDMVVDHVPEAVSFAMDLRVAEKQALMGLSDELVQNLRPEIERLTSDLVHRTLQSVWNQRAKNDMDV